MSQWVTPRDLAGQVEYQWFSGSAEGSDYQAAFSLSDGLQREIDYAWTLYLPALGFAGPVQEEYDAGMDSEGGTITGYRTSRAALDFIASMKARGVEVVAYSPNWRARHRTFAVRLPDGSIVGQYTIDTGNDVAAFLRQFLLPAFSIAGGFGFIGGQIAAATGLPAVAAEGIARVAVTVASGGDAERAVLSIVVPQAVQTLVPTPDLLDVAPTTIDPDILELEAATVAELTSVPDPLLPIPDLSPVFEEAPLLTALPEVLPTFEPMPDIGSVWEETADAPVFFDEAPPAYVPPAPVLELPLEPAPFVSEPPIIEVPTMLDDPFTLPEGYDIGFDPYAFDIPGFDAIDIVTVDQVAPLTPDALASVEVADFASVPVTTVPPPAADEWTLREVITDATAAMVAAAGLVVAFNRLRDVAGGGAVNSTASARTGTGAQVQARDDGMVWTRDSQGRVTSSRPAPGLLQMTTTGNGIINNGDGTYTLIRPDGSRSTLRYPGTAGASGAGFAGLPAWAPWALAGGAALLLVAGRRN